MATDAAASRKVALEALEAAGRSRFRDLHPADVQKLRAFEKLRDDPAFGQALSALDGPSGSPAGRAEH